MRKICRARSALFLTGFLAQCFAAEAMSLREAVARVIETNPAIEAARASRRATEYEMKQAQGRALPQLSLDADVGQERINRPEGFGADVNDTWRTRRQVGLVARQFLFDGFDRANDVYKNASRVDAAALRVMARSEALALDAIEAYVDVLRNLKVLDISRNNVRRHRQILAVVKDLERGGKAVRSEVAQVEERLAGTEVAVERVQQSLLEARARFRRVVGVEPVNLINSIEPKGVPLSRQEAVQLGLANNPLIASAEADSDTAKSALDQSRAGYFPQVSVEVRGATGNDLSGTPGRSDEAVGKLVLSWSLFDGRIIANRSREFAERWGQAMAERDDRARQVSEEIERAIAARSTGQARLGILARQRAKAAEVVAAYAEEYKLAKRSLLDLLDSESSRFGTEIQLVSQEYIQLFTAYRILGTLGRILQTLSVAAPAEGEANRRQAVKASGPFSIHLEPLR